MATPKGILFEIEIDEKGLRKTLQKTLVLNGEKQKVSRFFSKLLYSCNNQSGNVFLLNFQDDKLFCAYIQNYFEATIFDEFNQILEEFAKNKTSQLLILQ